MKALNSVQSQNQKLSSSLPSKIDKKDGATDGSSTDSEGKGRKKDATESLLRSKKVLPDVPQSNKHKLKRCHSSAFTQLPRTVSPTTAPSRSASVYKKRELPKLPTQMTVTSAPRMGSAMRPPWARPGAPIVSSEHLRQVRALNNPVHHELMRLHSVSIDSNTTNSPASVSQSPMPMKPPQRSVYEQRDSFRQNRTGSVRNELATIHSGSIESTESAF